MKLDAIQHQQGYAPLRFRSALVPLANIGSSLSYMVIVLGIVLTAFGSAFGSTALWIGAGLMCACSIILNRDITC